MGLGSPASCCGNDSVRQCSGRLLESRNFDYPLTPSERETTTVTWLEGES